MNSTGRWVAIAGVAFLSAVAVAGLCLALYAAWLFHDLPDASELAEYRPPTSTRVYAWDGTLIGEFGRERRIFVPYAQLPPTLVRAFLTAEDRKFYEHGGIDITGMGRAMTRDVLALARGRRLQGGSTITQQVAKNVLLSNDVSFGRKIKEAILARRLEETLTKNRILELYLNEIWLGYRSYGVGAAAFNYFGKPLNDLSLAQMAYLAALPKGPDNYHPIRRKANAMGRRNQIIKDMADLGWVSRAAADAAMHEDLVVQTAPRRAQYQDADYFLSEVRARANATLGDKVEGGGLYLRTTLDSKLQTAARVALMRGLEAYDRRHGWRGALGHVEIAPGWEAEAKSKSPPSERRDWRAAVIELVQGGTVKVRLAQGGEGALEPADVAWARAGKGLAQGDLVFVEPTEAGRYGLRQVPAVNGALVAIEPRSGRVLAMVGGYSFSLSNFNRATQALRQPGSAFKPFVYATALENGFSPMSVITDAPISFTDNTGKVWAPQNDSRRYYGPTVFRNGLVFSRNVMTVRIAQGVGMKKISANAIKFGVVDQMAPVLAMSLGAAETTPFKLTAAYAAFANGGRKIEPHLIELAADRQGKAVFRADKRDCPRCTAPFGGEESPRIAPGGAQVMDPITAYQITTMLQGVTQIGTAAAVSSLGYPLAGKTGTTNDYRSAWFVGYSTELVVGVFVGFDDNRSLGHNETGAVDAVPIFIDFMRDVLKGKPKTDFTAPQDARFALVGGRREAFRPGTEPKPRPAVLETGPIPYDQAFPGGQLTGAPNAAAAAAQAPNRPPPELNGLF
ncbi:MAG TPA: penicillin-binding protein 1A [Caulobacteraceae bacterium]|nr:penicillin-binding protein 1A [Caulobacteraceae bacterium]